MKKIRARWEGVATVGVSSGKVIDGPACETVLERRLLSHAKDLCRINRLLDKAEKALKEMI